MPQFGPGKGAGAPLDLGRFLQTGAAMDRLAFRTPPLRNVELTAPYMHDGAFASLEEAVLQHLNGAQAARSYDRAQLPIYLQETLQNGAPLLADMEETADSAMASLALDDGQLTALLAFLTALTDPAAAQMERTWPVAVPSGLTVPGTPEE